MHTVSANWIQGMAFDGHVDQHIFRMDSPLPHGLDSGPSPKKLLLISLITCTGMDVVSLLQKMRVPFDRFEVWADADLAEDHPKVYTAIRLTYRIWGAADKKSKVEKAVQMSKTTFCGVSIMLQKACPITYTIDYK